MLASQVEARTLSQLPFLQDLQAPAEVLDSIVSEEAAYHKLSLAERSLSLQQQKDKKEGYYKESPRSKDLSSKVSKAQETLDAAKASTTKAINTHYRKASRTLHPDKSTGSRVEFERLVDARSCLVDPRLRHLYVEQMNQVVQTLGIKYAQTCHGPWVLKNLRLLQENGVSMSSTPTSPPVKRLTGGITSDIPRKARVQVRNHAERRLHVTLPLPRNLVSYATYCTNVQVVASENPSEAQPTTVALLQGTEILQRLEKDQYEVTVDDVMLPMSNPTVYIRWFATLQVNGKTLTSPYSMETEVDLTSPEERLRLLDFQATQELAKQRLSDIQTLLPTLVRHTSPHDDTLEVLQAKYDRLHSTLARGQSTLTQLQLLLRKETHHNSSSAAKIQQALQEALELAVAAKARLQVRLDENSKRGSLKEFKGRVADLLEQGKAATWLQAATRSDMEALGGEPNRLYQLLIEGRGLEVDPDTLGAAATRSDLFTEKQLQALQTRQQEVATKVAQETQRALEDAKKQRELEKQQREMQRQALATKALQDRQREELRARIMAEQSYAQAAAAPGDSLPSGTLVEVFGLTSTEGAPLNGTCGLIEFKRGDRYIVRCDLDGKFRSIPANKIRERQESTATGTTDVESPTWTCAVCTFVHEKALAKETACNMCQTARGATTYTEAVAKSASAQQPQTIFVSRKNSVKVPKRASLVSSSKSASLTLAQKPTTTTTLTKKTTTAADTRKTKHRCKHGTECRYLRKGPNVCTFYHPPHEVASVPQPSKRIFIKPSVVGWIIGKNGNHIQELMELTGADIWVDQKDMGPDELRIVNITGNQQQVDLAVQVVKDTVNRVTIQDGAYSSAPEEPSEAPDAVDTSISTLGSASPGLQPIKTEISFIESASLEQPEVELPCKRPESSPADLPPVKLFEPAVMPSKQQCVSRVIRKTPFAKPTMEQPAPIGGQPLLPSIQPSSKVVSPPSPPPLPTPASSSPASDLLFFLQEHNTCIKGSPEEFYEWLSSEDITTVEDLSEAVSDDEYLRTVLQPGDGTVGIKGFKRVAFKKAVEEATTATDKDPAMDAAPEDFKSVAFEEAMEESASAVSDHPTMDAAPNPSLAMGHQYDEDGDDKKAVPIELFCPLSRVLMVNDPVIAADGITYERLSIESWFRQQRLRIDAAWQDICTGNNSQYAHVIYSAGVLSPCTRQRMHHLQLTPNHVVRKLARDVARNTGSGVEM